ncbi:MAG: helix-turn-helix domain-containing protein [Thermodesulfobacteriota bacterium]
MSLGERIREIRQSLGWTQDRLAGEAGISKSFLSEVENDKASVSGENLLKIANALNASLDYLMKGSSPGDDARPRPIEIPPELSDVSEELGLSYKATLALLSTEQALLARRSSKERQKMTREKWKDLYLKLKGYLD